MHEYRLADNKTNSKPPGCDIASKKGSLRVNSIKFWTVRICMSEINKVITITKIFLLYTQLDDWVLCRIYKKNNTARPMDHERDHQHHHHHHHDMNDFMASMTPSISLGSHNKYHHHQGLIKTTTTCNYGALLENEHNNNNSMMFEPPGLMSSDGSISHLTSAPKQHLLSTAAAGSGVIPVKRTLPALYWNDEGNACTSPPTKRFLTDGATTTDDGGGGGGGGGGTRTDDINTSNSIASLLSQLPQTPNSLQQQSLLGSLGDGAVFRQPYQVSGMNWYS